MPFDLDVAQAHCVSAREACAFLEQVSDAYALNDKERADSITYCLPTLAANTFTLVQLVDPAEHGRVAAMTVTPRPDTVNRLFMSVAGEQSGALESSAAGGATGADGAAGSAVPGPARLV